MPWSSLPSFCREAIKFALVVLVVHLLWGRVYHECPDGSAWLFGCDVSHVLMSWSSHIARVVGAMLTAVGEHVRVLQYHVLLPSHQVHIAVVGSCTGLKHLFIMTLTLLVAQGPYRDKCWYIPMALIVLVVFNYCRIFGIAWLLRYGFPFAWVHEGGKVLFYLVIFALWVGWQERK